MERISMGRKEKRKKKKERRNEKMKGFIEKKLHL